MGYFEIVHASLTTECASAFTSCGRLGLFFDPLGRPPSLALRLAARALRADFATPMSAPMLMSCSVPQVVHVNFMHAIYPMRAKL